MEPVTIIVGGVALVISAAVAIVVKKYKEIQRLNETLNAFRRSLEVYSETYSLETPDDVLVRKCQATIQELFHGDIEKEFAKRETLEEKKAFAQDVIRELANCMSVTLDEVVIKNLGEYTYGTTDSENGKTIWLNEMLLIADPEKLIRTMCHELKHCVQIQSLTNNTWGYSDVRIAQYLYSLKYYVQGDTYESYEAYRKQIIEIDANKFADEVFK